MNLLWVHRGRYWWPMAGFALWMLAGGVLRAPIAAAAVSVETRFFEAETCQRELEADARRQQYRHHWLRCIDKFNAVYRQEPDGRWAAAGLFRAGALYLQLGRRSGLSADHQEGLDLLQRLVRRFPSSAYRAKANRC